MTILLATCDNCGILFGTDRVIGGNGTVTVQNCSTNCPMCGGKSRMLDGTYKFVENAIEIINTSKRSWTDLKRLVEVLQTASKENKSGDEISAIIKETTPELSSISDLLPKTQSDLIAYILLLIAIINMFINILQFTSKPNIEVNQVINHIYINSNVGSVNNNYGTLLDNPINVAPSGRKVGRNDLCPCGSGLKYKKCCIAD